MSRKKLMVALLPLMLIVAATAWRWLGVTSGDAIAPVASDSPRTTTTSSESSVLASAPEDTRSVAPPAELIGATVRVTDTDDAPIGGAELYSLAGSESSATLLGLTSSAGLLALEEFPRAGSLLVARAAGFAPESRAMGERSAEPDVRIVLRMRPSAKLRGRVVDTHAAAVGAGVRVLAWPSSMASNGEDHARRALAGDPREQLASTSASGEFTFDGLFPGEGVFLIAAGKGFASASLADAKAGQPEIAIVTVERTYAAILAFETRSGEPVGLTDRVWRDTQSQIQSTSDCISRISGAPFVLSNAGAKLETLPGYVLTACLACEQAAPSISGNRLRAVMPGYLDVDATFDAYPLGDDLPVTPVIVVPVAEAMLGRVEVTFVAYGGPIDAALRDFVPDGRVELRKDLGDSPAFVVSYERGTPTVLKVPFGTYRPWFRAVAGELAFPPPHLEQELVVGPVPVQFVIEVGGLGAIAVSAIDADGNALDRPLTFLFSRGRPEVNAQPRTVGGLELAAGARFYRHARSIAADKLPFMIRGVSPGVYSLTAEGSSRGAIEGNQDGVVSVDAGRVTEVTLRVQ